MSGYPSPSSSSPRPDAARRPGHWRGRWHSLGIWGFGLGYFLFYIPYAFLVAAITRGLLPGTQSISGFELLPSTVLATVIVTPTLITGLGWWRYAGRRRVLGVDLPMPGWRSALAGLGFAVIIPTTTLAYTWPGVSILFAVLLLRGGVLMLSPIVDTLFGRTVRWFSWVALALTAAAWIVAFADVESYQFTVIAGVNTAAYLAGYVARLPAMTLGAKRRDPVVTRRFFVEEQMVAMPVLLASVLAIAALGTGPSATAMQRGLTVFLQSDAIVPALLVGVCYGCLGFCGTMIYLDARENTFCIPLNRCASLLSVVVASYFLHWLLGEAAPNASQLVAAALTASALLLLSPLHHVDRYAHAARAWLAGLTGRAATAGIPAAALPAGAAHRALQRVFLFVCSGNTSRSPMAQALCRAEIAALLGLPTDRLEGMGVAVLSAGLSARPGTPMTEEAQAGLASLGLARASHTSRDLTPALVQRANVVFCMTEQQAHTVRERFPDAAHKVQRLDPDGDVDDPTGGGTSAYVACAARLRQLVRQRLGEAVFAA